MSLARPVLSVLAGKYSSAKQDSFTEETEPQFCYNMTQSKMDKEAFVAHPV